MAQPHLWRTRCGFRFASCNFERLGSLDSIPIKQHCRKCFLKTNGSESSLHNSAASTESSDCGDAQVGD